MSICSRSDPDAYTALINNKDHVGIMELLTHAKVEDEVVHRVIEKVETQLQYLSSI